MSTALVSQHSLRMRHVIFIICGLSGCTIFSTLSHKRHDFRETFMEHKMCILNCLQLLSEIFLILRIIQWNVIINIYIGFQVKYPLMKLDTSRYIFEKSSNTKFNENPSIGSRVVSCGRTDRETWRSWEWLFSILWTRLKNLIEKWAYYFQWIK